MDLKGKSKRELKALLKDIESEIARRRKQDLRDAKRVVGDIAKKHGFTLQQLLANAPAPVKRKTRQSAPRPPKPPKYQDPRSPEKAWSGFGVRSGRGQDRTFVPERGSFRVTASHRACFARNRRFGRII